MLFYEDELQLVIWWRDGSEKHCRPENRAAALLGPLFSDTEQEIGEKGGFTVGVV